MSFNLSESEKDFMDKAFCFAQEALSAQEVPVGCIFVYDLKIIASGRNTVNETRNATRHAEINCIDTVTTFCHSQGLDIKTVFSQTQVFVTVEPCIMCMNSLLDLNVKSIVFGCKNDRFGGQTVFNVGAINKCNNTKVVGGVRADEAMNLLKEFYKGVNYSAPPSKVKVRNKKI